MEDLKPSWLNEEFLQQVLRSVEGVSEEKRVTISKWRCCPAVPPGTNYLSLLYRLSVDYEIDNDARSISLIVKTPLEEDGQMKQFMEKNDGYGRELRMYSEVLPKMYEIAGNSISVSARAYACPLHNSLVLEDLREQGYKMADRLRQLDAAHCKQFLKSLAIYHGLSVALKLKEPQVIYSVGRKVFFDENESPEAREKIESITKYNLLAMVKTIQSIGLERYANIIEEKMDSFYEKILKILSASCGLIVLNHADCWTTNVLFKYNEVDEVIDAKLVDFQMVRVGSYAQDLIHFWWSSARRDVRENLQEEMFEFYRKTLNQTLEDVRVSERVSKEELASELRRFSSYALLICSSVLPVAMADPDDLVNFNLLSADEIKEPINEYTELSKNYRRKYYKAILPEMLGQLERFGAL